MSAQPPADVWADDRVAARESPIEGRGLFAGAAIPAGTPVLRLGGRLVDSAELDRLIGAATADPSLPYVDTITVFADAHIVLPHGTLLHFGNHSCDPTLWHDGPYSLIARRDIDAGEELTLDYGTGSGAAGFEMTCACRSVLCRGRITSEDWRNPALRRRYVGHWTPALQSRIDEDLR